MGTRALVHFALPHYFSLIACMYWLALHCFVELHREKLAKELLLRFLGLLALSADLGWLVSL